MVHYIRFLRTPQVSENQKKGVTLSAVATVTTDLGDSFYGENAELLVRLVDATGAGSLLQSQTVSWQDGSRAVKLSMICNPKLLSRLARLHLTTKASAEAISNAKVPEILDVWSEPFMMKNGSHTEEVVERQLLLPGKCCVRQWEETGDSIARHVWDASLGFLILFSELFFATNHFSLPILRKFLLASPTSKLRVLELGSGCGIVGIALAQLRKSEMVLTDLDDAQEILQRNVDCATPLAGSNIRKQVLGWGSNLGTISEAKFDLILVSDCIYNPDSSVLLVETLKQISLHNSKVLILVGYKRRHDADDIFFERMRETGFKVAESHKILLPHNMTDYDSTTPEVELSVYESPQT